LPALTGEISGLQRPASPLVLANFSLARISINNCSIPLEPRPQRRAILRDISLFECEHYACSADGASFQDIVVTDLRGYGKAPSLLSGCAYSHVTLRGRMGGLWFRPQASMDDPQVEAAYRSANAAHYATTDWALDITEAKFGHFFSLAGIPASLVRRNAQLHFAMTRDGARVVASEANRTVWGLCAQELLDLDFPDAVLVTGGSPKLRRSYLDDAARLRERGLIA
jgi:hypothetical protein